MPLSNGTRLGPYEIQAAIGAGGMGEVYRARDTRLNRTVAIKVLPPEFREAPERRARFEREAKILAGLDHPHICTLYDVGDHDGSTYLVMEHLAGETLADRLRRGPLPLRQVLVIAVQIAEALDAAHKHGILHRDLKPANVMLTAGGSGRSGSPTVKLLDFGVARVAGRAESDASSADASTLTLTATGAVIGTLAYMAPEQLDGRQVDARTDLWALGAVLYEMIAGRRAFAGESDASRIAAIMNAEPVDLTTLQPLAPPALSRLVMKCLAKAPDDRWDTAHDVASELRWILESTSAGTSVIVPARPRSLGWVLFLGLGSVAVTIAGAGVMWVVWPMSPRPTIIHTSVEVNPAEEIRAGGVSYLRMRTPGGSRTAFAWTPDGEAIVFVGQRGGEQQLYVRRLDAAEARPLADTERAQVPSVSLDGKWVAFWARRSIRKVAVAGGPAVELVADIRVPPFGLCWSAQGDLFFGREDGRIWRLSEGRTPAPVTTLGHGEWAHVLPSLLPDQRTLLFTVRRRAWSWGDEEIVGQDLATGQRRLLVTDGIDARFVASGHLVFLRRGTLFAAPFSPSRVTIQGPPVPVLSDVAQALTATNSNDITGAGQFAISSTGTLALIRSSVTPFLNAALVTVDRQGTIAALGAPVKAYTSPVRLSPDGRSLAVSVRSVEAVSVWLYDLRRDTLTMLLGTGEAESTTWSPDGRRLFLPWLRDGQWCLAAQSVHETSPPQVLLQERLTPSSFTPDGTQLATVSTAGDIVFVALDEGNVRVRTAEKTPATEDTPVFSPDGRWIAYTSNRTGRWEVYLRSSQGQEREQAVSREGGMSPAWSPNGRELFFLSPVVSGRQTMMAVDVDARSSLRIGRPTPLFQFDPGDLPLNCEPVRCFDVAQDGQRFYAIQYQTPPPSPAITHVGIVQNWVEELNAKAPVSR